MSQTSLNQPLGLSGEEAQVRVAETLKGRLTEAPGSMQLKLQEEVESVP